MARKFLYFVVFCIIVVIGVLLALRVWADEFTQVAFVPDAEFVEQDPLANNAYNDPAMWFSRPGLGVEDPARWQPAVAAQVEPMPAGTTPEPAPTPRPTTASEASSASDSPAPAPESATPPFAVFFVHPTSYFDRSQWNAPLDHADSQARARLFLRGMASAFNQASEIWAPRYRQATFGAFLTDQAEAEQAIDAAYHDVEQAFEFFLDSVGPDTPIVLAGHSQGAVHVMRLLKDRIAGSELEQRVAMAYPIGWPISVEHDLPALGLPPCATPNQFGCIMGWASFSEPAEPGMALERYRNSPGFDGLARGDYGILCVNPLTGTIDGEAPAEKNLGTLVPNADLTSGELVPAMVPARCDERGLLLIGEGPDLGAYVLPGGNYHVFDIPLFWRNLQDDVVRRVQAWTANRS